MNYEEDIRIDETALDIEWLEQPSLMMRYARHSAKTKMEADLAKEQLDLAKAELDKNIRTDPEKFGISGKVTEAAVTAAIISHKDYVKANRAFLDAKYEADVASAAVRAIDARKDALENLVRLHGQQYFAGPKVPRDLAWEKEERQKRMNSKIKDKMTRTK